MKLQVLCVSALLTFAPHDAAQCQGDLLTPPSPSFLKSFGYSVDRDGDLAAVGSFGINDDTPGASVYRREGEGWVLEQTVLQPVGDPEGGFGRRVALDGDRLLVSATGQMFASDDYGAVYLFQRDTSGPAPVWNLETTFHSPSTLTYNTGFGVGLAIEGDTVVIGAHNSDEAGGVYSGGAYVYRRSGSTWSLTQTLTPNVVVYASFFGSHMELEDGLLMIGSSGDNTAGPSVGAAYAFVDGPGGFSLEEKLVPAPPYADFQGFGIRLDIDSSAGAQRVVISGSTTVTQEGIGRVYMYRRETAPGQPASYVIEDGILATDGEDGDFFGISLSLEGDRLLVGADRDSDHGEHSGAAYLYERDGSEWREVRKLYAADPELHDRFGQTVMLDGDRAMVGAPSDDGTFNGEGAVHLMSLDTIDCPAVCDAPRLPGDGADSGSYGAGVGISGDFAVVGAPGDDQHGPDAGRARVYHRFGDCWIEESELVLGETDSDDLFGTAVAIDGERVVVGAPGDEANLTFSGMAYVWHRIGVTWAYDGQLAPWGVGPNAQFGRSVAIDEEKAMVGYLSPGTAGAVRAFREAGPNAWVQDDTLFSLQAVPGDDFGASIAIDGDRSIVGAPGTENGQGAVYLFDYANFEWTESAVLIAPFVPAGTEFGASVAIEGSRVAVGAPGGESVYVFEEGFQPFVGWTWSLREVITSPVPAAADRFGASVALANGRLVVGAPASSGQGAGASYVYETNGSAWQLVRIVRPAGSADGDLFGASVDASGDDMMAGAPGSAAAFAYELDEAAPSFSADFHAVSIAGGGTQSFLLDAGKEHAGKLYWILGSVTGTAPGTMLLNALMPLNQDAYFDLLLIHPDASTVSPIIDFLDGEGRATSGVTVIPGTLTGHEGLVIDHAYLLLGGGQIDFVSNPVSMVLVP